MKITFYDQSGKKVKDVDLSKDIFSVEPNRDLMHRLLILQRSNARQNAASSMTKWDTRWWWRKPYKQKWTGRARQWSVTNPHYIWWWVSHWPTWIENYIKKMPKKARRLALFWFLVSKMNSKDIFWLDSYEYKKTKDFVNMLSILPTDGKDVLFVLSEKDNDFILSARNIPWVKVILTQYLNPVDLTSYKKLCFVWSSLETLDKIFLN